MKTLPCLAKLLIPVLVAGALTSVSVTRADAAGQKYALLIGVNDYADSLTDLQYCRNDVQELRDVLLASGFPKRHVICMCDGASPDFLPSKENIDRMLRLWLYLASDEEDLVVVAFSGHGFYDEGGDKSYLCPFDANTNNLTDTCISMEDVYDQMHKCRAGQKVLMIDACRNMTQFRRIGLKSNLSQIKGFVPDSHTKGIRVMSSCEAGQVSVEDRDFQHGVFMYYVALGLRGSADKECEGNDNGKVSLDELYHYAHQRTKIHVATKHQTSQLPWRMGEVTGLCEFGIARGLPSITPVPRPEIDHSLSHTSIPATPTATVNPTVPATSSVPCTSELTPTPHRSAYEALSKQAGVYVRDGDYGNAIEQYTAIVDDTSLPTALRNKARRSRGAAYLARAKDNDLEKAIIDHKAAGLDGIQMSVKSTSSPLKLGTSVKGTVENGQVLLVTNSRDEWLWVSSVNGDTALKGWIMKSAVLKQKKTPSKSATPVQNYRPQYHQPRYHSNTPVLDWIRSQQRANWGW